MTHKHLSLGVSSGPNDGGFVGNRDDLIITTEDPHDCADPHLDLDFDGTEVLIDGTPLQVDQASEFVHSLRIERPDPTNIDVIHQAPYGREDRIRLSLKRLFGPDEVLVMARFGDELLNLSRSAHRYSGLVDKPRKQQLKLIGKWSPCHYSLLNSAATTHVARIAAQTLAIDPERINVRTVADGWRIGPEVLCEATPTDGSHPPMLLRVVFDRDGYGGKRFVQHVEVIPEREAEKLREYFEWATHPDGALRTTRYDRVAREFKQTANLLFHLRREVPDEGCTVPQISALIHAFYEKYGRDQRAPNFVRSTIEGFVRSTLTSNPALDRDAQIPRQRVLEILRRVEQILLEDSKSMNAFELKPNHQFHFGLESEWHEDEIALLLTRALEQSIAP